MREMFIKVDMSKDFGKDSIFRGLRRVARIKMRERGRECMCVIEPPKVRWIIFWIEDNTSFSSFSINPFLNVEAI